MVDEPGQPQVFFLPSINNDSQVAASKVLGGKLGEVKNFLTFTLSISLTDKV